MLLDVLELLGALVAIAGFTLFMILMAALGTGVL